MTNNQYKLMIRIMLVILSLLTYCSFTYLYKTEISPIEAYRGFVYKSVPLFQEGVRLFFLFLPISFLPIVLTRPSDIGVWILYLIPYQSTIYMALHINRGPIYTVYLLWLSILASLLIVSIFRKHKFTIRFPKYLSRNVKIMLFFLLIYIYICYYFIDLMGFNFNFGLDDSYVRRMVVRDTASPLYGYVVAIARSLFMVSGVYLAVVKKQWWYIPLVFIVAMSIFSYSGNKTIILYPILFISLTLLLSHFKNKYILPLFLFFCFFVIVMALVEVKLFQSNIISQLIVRRTFACPGFLTTAFWDFFSNNPKTLMTESIGKFFIDPIYSIDPTFLVGIEYFNNEASNANTGIWLGAFAQFGILGMLSVSCLAGFIFGFVDNLTKGDFFILGCLVCAFMGLNWSEQMFHTSILSGGVFYLFMGVVLLRFSKNLQQVFSCRTF